VPIMSSIPLLLLLLLLLCQLAVCRTAAHQDRPPQTPENPRGKALADGSKPPA
jgi:cell division protein FtsL